MTGIGIQWRKPHSWIKQEDSTMTQASEMEKAVWRRVNDEPFEYAIQQGPHGDEFIKLLDGSCLRRSLSLSDAAVPIADWKIVKDERVLIYVVHPHAQYEADEAVRRERWEGWFLGSWTDFNKGGWTYHGMLGTVTHVAPLPPVPQPLVAEKGTS